MTIKNLMIKMNQACAQHMGKVIYTLFLLTLLGSLCSSVFLFPAVKIFSDPQIAGTVPAKIIFFALVLAALTVWLTFQFGFSIMLLRMVRNENTNLGFLFMGFRKFNPAGKVILSLAAIFSLTGIITRFITKAIFAKLWPLYESLFTLASAQIQAAAENTALPEGTAEAAGSILPFTPEEAASLLFESGLFAGIFFLLAFIILIHFVFVFHLHFDRPAMKAAALFKESFRMMRGNVFRLIGFSLRAGGKNLLIAIVLAVIVSFIPENMTGLSLLAFLFDLAYFINLYTALTKFYFAVPVMYEQIINKD